MAGSGEAYLPDSMVAVPTCLASVNVAGTVSWTSGSLQGVMAALLVGVLLICALHSSAWVRVQRGSGTF